jgi:hypothetical protein
VSVPDVDDVGSNRRMLRTSTGTVLVSESSTGSELRSPESANEDRGISVHNITVLHGIGAEVDFPQGTYMLRITAEDEFGALGEGLEGAFEAFLYHAFACQTGLALHSLLLIVRTSTVVRFAANCAAQHILFRVCAYDASTPY